ncbi:hypothetical protein DUZ89_16885 [Klebsiella variicola]|nr:hypothetical protein DUZ89_16885 [Klebsiella variicola]
MKNNETYYNEKLYFSGTLMSDAVAILLILIGINLQLVDSNMNIESNIFFHSPLAFIIFSNKNGICITL